MKHSVIVAAFVAAVSLIARAAQPPAAALPVVSVDRLAGGVARIVYNLPGAADSTFTVTVEASIDGGQTFGIQPRAVAGDVGANVRAGASRTIEWDTAKDIEDLQFDRLVFRIRATPSTPIGTGAPTGGNRATATGSVRIVSEPAGASVAIDGQRRGRTPLTLADLAVGDHKLTLTMTDYLENSRTIAVAAGQQTDVQVPLTHGTPATAPSGGGGGMPKWIIPVIAAGVAGGVLAAKSGSSSPGPTPPIPQTGTWSGTGSTLAVPFGGAPFCNFTVTASNITASITLGQGSVTDSRASFLSTETTSNCSSDGLIRPNTHVYTWSAFSGDGTTIDMQYAAAPGNDPRADCRLHGTFSSDNRTIQGTLTVHRTDQTSALDWTLIIPLTLTHQ